MGGRFRWAISEGDRIETQSWNSYGTLNQAETAANEAVRRIKTKRR